MSEELYKALGTNIIIKEVLKETTKGGLYLPAASTPNGNKFESAGDREFYVVDVGSKCESGVKVGDQVFLMRSYGTPLPQEEDKKIVLIAMEEKYVVAVKR